MKGEKMSDIENIFKRATVKGITSYLLSGQIETPDNRDYQTRLDEAFSNFDEEALKLDKRQPPILLDKANELAFEVEEVYTEIGLKTGIMLMQDIMRNMNMNEKKELTMYKKMYYSLFNSVTRVLDILKNEDIKEIDKVISILEKAQCDSEEYFANSKALK